MFLMSIRTLLLNPFTLSNPGLLRILQTGERHYGLHHCRPYRVPERDETGIFRFPVDQPRCRNRFLDGLPGQETGPRDPRQVHGCRRESGQPGPDVDGLPRMRRRREQEVRQLCGVLQIDFPNV